MQTKGKLVLALALIVCVTIVVAVYVGADRSPSGAQQPPPPPQEVVSSPNMPSGPSTGNVEHALTFSVGGASSSRGYDVRYHVDWGDNTNSDTGPIGAGSVSLSKTWNSPGTYYVRARAISTSGVVSDWSGSRQVTIERVQQETVFGTLKDYRLPGQHHHHWRPYILSGRELSVSWSADGAVDVYVLTETQYEYFRVWGFTMRYVAYRQASRGTLFIGVPNSDTYFIVINNPSWVETYKVYSAEAKVTWWD